MSGFSVPQLSVQDAATLLKSNPAAKLLDVRTEEEYSTARIPGSTLVSREELLAEILKLPRDTPLVVHCHHGFRSLSGAGYFLQQGFNEVYNLAGGIDAWSQQIDPSIPRY